MNYTRRPNRPDGDVYRQMRRQSLDSSRRSGLRRPRAGLRSGLRGIWLLVFVVAVASVIAWRLMH